MLHVLPHAFPPRGSSDLGLFPATLLAILFYGYSVYDIGLPLIAFFFHLIAFGWALGLALSGMVLRWGLGAESLAWIAVFAIRSEEHTSELQSLMRISYAVFCLKKNKQHQTNITTH